MPGPADRKVAVITGGGSGIGLAIARALAYAGFSVVITGRSEARLNAAVSLCRDESITSFPCDVTDPRSVEKLFSWVRDRYASLQVLVNNAGVAHALASVPDFSLETWKQVIDTNLTGTFLCARAALPLMSAGSAIVNNLSVAAVKPFPGMSAYNASKAGALGFTNVLREELRSRGIRVLALLPGATDTDIWNQFWSEAPREKMVSADTVAQLVLNAVLAPPVAMVEEIRIGPTAGAL
ncbi:MAG TPA: SDR family NAD(P)-dependent oxidoreductase [Candidatus Angelobacter sp.]|nr:SDR family NAD(P)-dependent oxidoreductase [Candidatus Angelobacter sp.]